MASIPPQARKSAFQINFWYILKPSKWKCFIFHSCESGVRHPPVVLPLPILSWSTMVLFCPVHTLWAGTSWRWKTIRKCYCPLHYFPSWAISIKAAVRGLHLLTMRVLSSFCQKTHQSCFHWITDLPSASLGPGLLLCLYGNWKQSLPSRIEWSFGGITVGATFVLMDENKSHLRRETAIYA